MNLRNVLLVVGLSLLLGCTRSPVVPVSGTISFPDRETPEVCRLTFVPTETNEDVVIRPSGATMDENGIYHLTEFKGVEGLLPGTYSIRVNYFDLKKNGNADVEGDWKEQTFEAGELVVEDGARSVEHDIEVR